MIWQGRLWTPPSSSSNLQDRRRRGAAPSLSSPPSPVPPPRFVFFSFFPLSFQFPFDVPVISAFHLMEISPGCVSAARAASRRRRLRTCWILVCGGQGRFGGSQGAGQEHPSAVGSWSGSVGGLRAGEGPLSSEQPHVWQGTGPGAAALEPNLSQALLHPSFASFLPPSASPPPPPSLSLHLYPPSISIPSTSPSSFHLYPSTPLLPPSPSSHLPPIPPKTTPEDTKNGARGVSNQLSQPSSSRVNVQPQTSTPKTQG